MKISRLLVAWLASTSLICLVARAQSSPSSTPASTTPAAPSGSSPTATSSTATDQTPPAPADPSDADKAAAAAALAALQSQVEQAQSMLSDAEHGNGTPSSNLLSLVDTLRTDTRVPEYDRYVLVARTLGLTTRPTVKDRKAKFAAFADLDRKLIGLFPQQAEPYASMLALAEDSLDAGSAGAFALELTQFPQCPDAIKAAANRIVDREAMVGTSIDFSATDSRGNPLSLSQFRGKVVVLYVWTGHAGTSANWVNRFIAQGNTQVVFLGLNFDSDSAAAQARMAQVAPDSLQVYDSTGPGGQLATSLILTRCPTVYLIDRRGVLQDVHGLDQFSDKLTKILGVTH